MESDIREWILSRLSNNLEEFNNMPACPFAKQALLDNKIKIIELKKVFEHISMSEYFLAELENFTYHWPDGLEVIVIGCDPSLITATELSNIAEKANDTFLDQRGYIVLEDHPNEIEQVSGYVVNQGSWALLLLQSKDKIKNARRILEHKGYYNNWDKNYYKEVVLDRS